MLESPRHNAQRPSGGRIAFRPNGYTSLFVVMGLIGTTFACRAGDEKLFFLWVAWSIALTTTGSVWMAVAAFRRALSAGAHDELPGESWLPLRGRWLRLLIVAPVLLPSLALGWLFGTLLLAAVGAAIQSVLWH